MAADQLRALVEILDGVLRKVLSGTPAEADRAPVLGLLPELLKAVTPRTTFDTADPKVAARMATLALLSQPRIPLCNVPCIHGSGIFAIYYEGANPLYTGISGSETPIYVGRVDPEREDASSPVEQGTRLTRRLSELGRSITSAETYASSRWPGSEAIRLSDFQYKHLVCATHAQLIAAKYLTELFWPLWNNETLTCWGIAKHGYSTETRMNRRSPWDVAHPGRGWALGEGLQDALTLDEIRECIAITLRICPARRDPAVLYQEILNSIFQGNLSLSPGSIPPVKKMKESD